MQSLWRCYCRRGNGLIFIAGSTTGGTDILGYVLQKKRPHISIGRALMIVDGIILAVSIFVFGNIEAALFGMIALYVQTKLLIQLFTAEKREAWLPLSHPIQTIFLIR